MRVAAIYDIHGNLPALEAVVQDIRRAAVDLIVVGGDVLPGPMPRETLEYLLDLDLPVRFIHGNGDRVVQSQMAGIEPSEVPEQFRHTIRWNAQQLRPQDQQLLASWPATIRVEMADVGTVVFCHASTRNDTDVFTRLTPEDRLLPLFEGVDAAVVVCGHTHMQFDRMIGRTRVVNAGSVGMPFEEPGAYWLLLAPQPQLRRTDYDRAAAADRIRATEYPQAEEFATRNVLESPSEAATLEAFSRVPLK
jgi:putative phosphoesterase